MSRDDQTRPSVAWRAQNGALNARSCIVVSSLLPPPPLQALRLGGGQLAEEGGDVDNGAGTDQALAVWVQEAARQEIWC